MANKYLLDSSAWIEYFAGTEIIGHELFHGAFAGHASDTYRYSWMGGWSDVTGLPEDKLASCIVYSSDTKPGNRAPDTNPTYSR